MIKRMMFYVIRIQKQCTGLHEGSTRIYLLEVETKI